MEHDGTTFSWRNVHAIIEWIFVLVGAVLLFFNWDIITSQASIFAVCLVVLYFIVFLYSGWPQFFKKGSTRAHELSQAYLRGIAFIIVVFYGLNWALDTYVVPEFARQAVEQKKDGTVKVKKQKGFGSFFKRKKKTKKQAKAEKQFFDSTSHKEAVLGIGIKAALGAMLLFISFLITLFALGIECIFIGWLLVCKAFQQALMFYGLEVVSPLLVIAGSIGVALIVLVAFLWMYTRK